MTQHSSASGTDPTGRSRGRSEDVDHRARVICAEMRRLQRRLLTYGPMPRQRLAESCGADHWREGTFEEALHEGVRTGALRELPLGWIEAQLGDGDH